MQPAETESRAWALQAAADSGATAPGDGRLDDSMGIGGLPPRAAGAGTDQLVSLLDQMPAMIWAIDPQLSFVTCRGGALSGLGLVADQLAGMTLFDFFQTPDASFLPIAETLRALRGEVASFELDWGSRIFGVRVAPRRNAAGQIEGAVAVAFDITEVRREEEEMRHEEEMLRRVSENVPDAVVVVDGEGNFLYASPSCQEQLGYSLEELNGVNFLALIEPDDLAIAQDAIVDVYRGQSYPFAVRMRRRDGSVGLMEAVGSAVTNEDGTRLLLVTMRDVSEEARSAEFVRHNEHLAELRRRAQETAQTLRQLLAAIESGEAPAPGEAPRVQELPTFDPPHLLPDAAAGLQQP
jgi:PAS domain S-box-containing protein